MKKSRSNNPDGRPPEYGEKLRTMSLSLPDSLIDILDARAVEAGVSRQRLIVEWLKIGTILDSFGFLRSTAEGTRYDEYPTCEPRGENSKRVPFTYHDAVEWYQRMGKGRMDEQVSGLSFGVVRDKEIKEGSVPVGASVARSTSRRAAGSK